MRFFDKDDPGAAIIETDQYVDETDGAYALAYIPKDHYEEHERFIDRNKRFIGVKEEFDENDYIYEN